MTNQTTKRTFIALIGALAVTGCVTVTPPPGGGGFPPPQPQPQPQPQPTPQPPSGPTIQLQNSFYSGRSGGKRIRALARRSGNSITLTSQTGANFTENYRNVGGENYRAPSGNSIRVTSSRSFFWRSAQFGGVTMND